MLSLLYFWKQVQFLGAGICHLPQAMQLPRIESTESLEMKRRMYQERENYYEFYTSHF